MALESKPLMKLLILVLITGLVALFFALGLQEYLTLEFVKESRGRFLEIYTHRPISLLPFLWLSIYQSLL